MRSSIPIKYQLAKKLARQVGHTLQDVKEIGPLLMKTGAKLYWTSQGRYYFLCGYSYHAMDVLPLIDDISSVRQEHVLI